jgi:DEAD/DEAH box helicase domain-containing protein
LQFLPLFYAWTPQSKHDGAAAGLLWPLVDAVAEESVEARQLPNWFQLLDENVATALGEHQIAWPMSAVVGDAVMDEQGEVVGEAELLLPEQKIALLLEHLEDQQAAMAYLQKAGWIIVSSAEDLVKAITQLNSGA